MCIKWLLFSKHILDNPIAIGLKELKYFIFPKH